MYVCGPTVYDSCHIGHARSVIVFDVIFRYLKSIGFDVTYIRNFTDIDDKIIKRANELNVDSSEIAEKYIKEFHEDMGLLNVEKPTFEPKATEHIDEIIKVIKVLIDNKLAYEVQGDVFFEVTDFGGYGKLSGRKLEEMEAGARIDIDDRKHTPFDFVLWKASKPGEPSWDSPWGKGRPGWHIECTAMSTKYMGETFDIHGGGKDLIFPHHENEIAQSEGAFGKPFAKYWVHNGFVNINHEKMSKSLGNFMMIKDVVKKYHPEAIRLFLLSNHYRSPIDFTEKSMDESVANLDKVYTLLERMKNISALKTNNNVYGSGDLWNSFQQAMNDDFNTAKGIGVLFDAVRHLNRALDNDAENLGIYYSDIIRIGGILGVFCLDPGQYFSMKKKSVLEEKEVDEQWVEKKIHERTTARKEGNYSLADQIRDELSSMNIILEDSPDGTKWKFGSNEQI
jgi:cysteinyl-tRNA synthetase